MATERLSRTGPSIALLFLLVRGLTGRAGWLTNFFAKVLRSSRQLEVGEVFEKPPLTA